MKRKLDSKGRPQLVNRPTASEMVRRRELVVSFYKLGFPTATIARALDIATTTVNADLRAIGYPQQRGPTAQWRTEELPRAFWRDDEQPKRTGPHYLNSLALSMVTNANEHFERQDAINLLAFDAHDAARASDEAWVATVNAKLSEFIAYLHRMQVVLVSEPARRRVIDGGEVPRLRVVEKE